MWAGLEDELWPKAATILTFTDDGNPLTDLRIQRDYPTWQECDGYCFADVEPLGVAATMAFANSSSLILMTREDLVDEARQQWKLEHGPPDKALKLPVVLDHVNVKEALTNAQKLDPELAAIRLQLTAQLTSASA